MNVMPLCSQKQCPMNFCGQCEFYTAQNQVNDSKECAESMLSEFNEGVLVGEMA